MVLFKFGFPCALNRTEDRAQADKEKMHKNINQYFFISVKIGVSRTTMTRKMSRQARNYESVVAL